MGAAGPGTGSFGAGRRLRVGDDEVQVVRLDALGVAVDHLPLTTRILLENLVRNEDGAVVTAEDVEALARHRPGDEPRPLAFSPERVLLQDFTGVPALVDLAALRDAVAEAGGSATAVEPGIPAELVVDHSISVDVFGVPDAAARNGELEMARNRERYEFLRWGQQAFDGLVVVPPNTGICHQVNLEHLARVVTVADGWAFPDTLVGTDSHTPMVNGLGVLGWGVGGIEAEAALLGVPLTVATPQVVGLELRGALAEGVTATDLVLAVTELLRGHGVVGRFVEFHGPGIAEVGVPDRATLANMSPEFGATASLFPIDDQTLRYLRATGRGEDHVALVEAYAKEQGLWASAGAAPAYDEDLVLDLDGVEPAMAGPRRPQDRVLLDRVPATVHEAVAALRGEVDLPTRRRPPDGSRDEAVAETFPASDPVTPTRPEGDAPPHGAQPPGGRATLRRARVDPGGGDPYDLVDGAVVIAAITSCTNTSNPSVMVAAGLLARNAVEAGLRVPPWVKTSLAPGSRVVVDYLTAAGLLDPLAELGFDLVGYGCTTCIGNSGPLPPEVRDAVRGEDLAVAAVLSGNRNFEGRINPDVRLNFLASPPLVVASALAGTTTRDLRRDPLGDAGDGPVHLRDVWPSAGEVDATVQRSITASMFRDAYADVRTGDERWQALAPPPGDRYRWGDGSTYIRRPPFLDGVAPQPTPRPEVQGARALVVLGDSVTTDHISPAGAIPPESPAGRWLIEAGVDPSDFNSYGARRGNHEVMIRGTFANPRLRNRPVDEEGWWTRHWPSGERMAIADAADRYRSEGVPLVVLAGREYGSGSSRDWAAKGTALLGVRAVLAESYERIHRSNLIGMGVVPLQFAEGDSIDGLGLTGAERFDLAGLGGLDPLPDEVEVRADDRSFRVIVRVDTPSEQEQLRHGGLLPLVLRRLV